MEGGSCTLGLGCFFFCCPVLDCLVVCSYHCMVLVISFLNDRLVQPIHSSSSSSRNPASLFNNLLLYHLRCFVSASGGLTRQKFYYNLVLLLGVSVLLD
ncbi:hypothetical protein N658DRAFT_208062 [Parathielavia hyrcaniae]|uniref:Uncharacterized protein n=1 Tax=Parathielavia hyrcaniae TaxID=113614 RepID=A0AAN6PW90_9PEZI|nr:hypothetical protein N658DRAFT_208062 [Parathielavia hyrcaniae]